MADAKAAFDIEASAPQLPVPAVRRAIDQWNGEYIASLIYGIIITCLMHVATARSRKVNLKNASVSNVSFGNYASNRVADCFLRPVVAVPVRDEAERLPSLLKSLARQTWIASNGETLQVVIVLNNCRDESPSLVRSMAPKLPQLQLLPLEIEFPPERAHVGSARRLAMDLAFVFAGQDGVLLSTDADAVPDDDWVEANLRAIRNGADLIGGFIVGNPDEERSLGPGFLKRAARQIRYASLVDQLTAIIDPVPYDPWPRHSDHTGASLAVRAEVYSRVGGLPIIPCREDVAFVTEVRRAGFRLRHAPDVRVIVSARLQGRAQGGMADCVRGWVTAEELGTPHLVEDPACLLRRLTETPREAIVLRTSIQGMTFSNAIGAFGVKGPEIDVDTAIARLEHMIAASRIR